MAEDIKILLVDDEIRIREVFSAMLNDLGYVVQTASSAEAALKLVSHDRFDIVFIDQFLGAARGLDVMGRMMDLCPELSFVIITGGNAGLAIQARKSGASDFISKPFFSADLIRSIEYVRKKKELERKLADLEKPMQQAARAAH